MEGTASPAGESPVTSVQTEATWRPGEPQGRVSLISEAVPGVLLKFLPKQAL